MEIIVGGLVVKNDKFLLVQEAKKKCYGKWNIPAGHLEPSETIIEGAKREILEETGCTVDVKGILELSDNYTENKYWLGIIFATKIIEENIRYNKNEILDVRWFTFDEILNMKDNLRTPKAIINCIETYIKGQYLPIDILKQRR